MKSKPIAGVLLLMVSSFAVAQAHFPTPDGAASALTKAISEQDQRAMQDLLGDNWHDALPPEGVDPDAVDRFLRDWQVKHEIVLDGEVAHLAVGSSGWQLPVPLVKTAEGWRRGNSDPGNRSK